MEASVWMTPLMGRPPTPSIFRERPLMMPRLRLCSRPKGLPKAKTFCPTRSLAEPPRGSGCMMFPGTPSATSLERPPTRNTATSLAASVPTTTASSVVRRSRPVLGSCLRNVTKGFSVPVMTWALVTMCFLSQTKPLPAMLGARSSPAVACGGSLEMDTTPGVVSSKRLVTSFSSVFRPRAGGAVKPAEPTMPAATSRDLRAEEPLAIVARAVESKGGAPGHEWTPQGRSAGAPFFAGLVAHHWPPQAWGQMEKGLTTDSRPTAASTRAAAAALCREAALRGRRDLPRTHLPALLHLCGLVHDPATMP
mmetsp:Transcript_1240/g.3561  ORF Transcript_1240/g.3561 Transcript_1240/m.3561 type:complete len:308 (+) Transcript_1240:590-1513(+)